MSLITRLEASAKRAEQKARKSDRLSSRHKKLMGYAQQLKLTAAKLRAGEMKPWIQK